jgi:alkylation response protein AidB-like acyl-CoA dehydrogenase
LLEADAEWWRQGMLSDGDSVAVNRALGEAGWIGMSWPVELGGCGLSRLTATLVEEVFGYHWLPLSSYLLSYKTIGAAIERFASAALVEQLLPPIARGELVFCQGFSEPGAGSDLGALTTRADLRGDTYVVTGHKIWTSSAQLADWIYLAVRTDRDAKHRGISVLVCPVDAPGIEVRTFPTLGGGFLCETFLDGVEIPAANLVGEVNGGWDVLMYTLDFERVTAEKIGGAAWVLDAVEERLFATGRLDGEARRCVLRLRGELEAARLLSFRAADMLDRGLPGSATSAMAKLAGARLMQRVGDASIDLLGLEGLGDASPEAAIQGRAAALYRASAGSTIAGGTAEVQQLVIARRGLGLR